MQVAFPAFAMGGSGSFFPRGQLSVLWRPLLATAGSVPRPPSSQQKLPGGSATWVAVLGLGTTSCLFPCSTWLRKEEQAASNTRFMRWSGSVNQTSRLPAEQAQREFLSGSSRRETGGDTAMSPSPSQASQWHPVPRTSHSTCLPRQHPYGLALPVAMGEINSKACSPAY